LNELIKQTREEQASTLQEVEWRGRKMAVKHEKVHIDYGLIVYVFRIEFLMTPLIKPKLDVAQCFSLVISSIVCIMFHERSRAKMLAISSFLF
jgi:hypothetical protein